LKTENYLLITVDISKKNLKKAFLFKYEFFGLIHFDLFFF